MNYERINWTTGTKVKEGYTIINGQEYQTVQPEYSGETPINVENLNHMDEGIYNANNKSSICCNCSSNTSTTSTSAYTQIPLTQILITGSKLRLSTNEIYADEACTVIVDAQIYINGGVSSSSTGVFISIRKNGSVYKRAACPIPNNYRMAQISGVLISLSANDYIDLGFYSGDKTGITASSGADTYITVHEI